MRDGSKLKPERVAFGGEREIIGEGMMLLRQMVGDGAREREGGGQD